MIVDNMFILQKKYPEIYKLIKSSKYDDENYKLLQTRTKFNTLKIEDFGLGFYIHSKYNPLKETERFVKNNYNNNSNNFIIVGFGLGYHIEKLLQIINGQKIYVFEFNKKIFYKSLKNSDLTSTLEDERLNLIISDDINIYIEKFEELLNSYEDFEIIFHTQSMKAIPDKYKEIKYLFEEFRMKIKNSNIKNLLSENFKTNIDNINESVDILFDKFNNIPAFLVSAGPSLDKNISRLKKIENKGLILCVGRALKALLNNNIQPHLIIITDPQDIVYKQIEGLNIEIPIVVLSTCNKNVALNYKGRKYISFQKGFDAAEELAKEKGYSTVDTGGSVATTGLDLLIKMGCNPIVFVGQDLAFSEEKTHSKEANHKDIINKNTLRKIKDINGNEVYTSKNLYSYLRWIQNRIIKENSITFIDSTEGGAKIIGTKILTLDESIKEFCYRDFTNDINLL